MVGVQVVPGNGPVGPAQVVVSYAHEDEQFVNLLRSHVALLRRAGDIDWWHDREILAGSDIDTEVDAVFESADVVIFIVSAHFLDSDYCYGIEVEKAMARHRAQEAIVIPVIARPCQWDEAPFAHLLAFPTDAKPIESFANPNDAYKDIADNLRKVIRSRKPKPIVSGDEFYTQTALVALRTNALLQRPSAPLAPRTLKIVAPDYVYWNRVFILHILATNDEGVLSFPTGTVFSVQIEGGEFVNGEGTDWDTTDAVAVVAQGDGRSVPLHARATTATTTGRLTVSRDGYTDCSTEFIVIPEHDLQETASWSARV